MDSICRGEQISKEALEELRMWHMVKVKVYKCKNCASKRGGAIV